MFTIYSETSSGNSLDSRTEPRDEVQKVPSVPETLLILFVTVGLIFFLTFVFYIISLNLEIDTTVMLFIEAFIIVPAIVYGKVRGYSFKHLFRLNSIDRKQLFATIVIGISLILIINYFENWLQNWLQSLPHSGWYYGLKSNFETNILKTLSIDSFYTFITIVLAVVFFAAFSEEMLFRGLVQQALENRLSTRWALFLTAFLFTILHPFSLISILILALVLSILSWRSNSIFPTIIIHGLNNGLSLVALNTIEELQANPAQGIGVSIYVFLFSIVVFIVSMRHYLRLTNK